MHERYKHLNGGILRLESFKQGSVNKPQEHHIRILLILHNVSPEKGTLKRSSEKKILRLSVYIQSSA